MKSPLKLLLVVCIATLVSLPQLSSAAISLTVDPGTKTLTFIGSDTGTSENLANVFQVASWGFGASSGTNESVDIAAAFAESFNNSAVITVYDGNLEDGLLLVFSNSGDASNSITSLTTNMTTVDYSGLSPTYLTILESFGSDTLTPVRGTSFSPIELTTIPEPGSTGLICAGVALMASRRRR